eukprot:g5311.t1
MRAVHAAALPPKDPCLSGHHRIDGKDSPISAWYFINVAGANAKEERVREQLGKCGVPESKIFRVPAVTEVQSVDSTWELWWHDGKSSRFSIHGIPVLLEQSLPLSSREIGVLLSHLRAARLAYDAGHQTVVVFEDDVSFEYVRWWNRGWNIGLNEVIHELSVDHGKDGWDICQLSMTMTNRVNVIRQVAHVLPQIVAGKAVLRRDPVDHRHVWGASAYVLSRSGMRRLLDNFWPGGVAQGMQLSKISSSEGGTASNMQAESKRRPFKGVFDFRRPGLPGHEYGSAYALSDVLLYSQPMRAFFSARPLFTYATDKSDIHSEHLAPQEQSKQLISRLLYLENRDNTDPHWWSFRDTGAEKGTCGCNEFIPVA